MLHRTDCLVIAGIIVTLATMYIAVAPVVTCKTHEYSADIGSNVTMTCTVSANPSGRVTWSAVVQSHGDFYSVLNDASVKITSSVRLCCAILFENEIMS